MLRDGLHTVYARVEFLHETFLDPGDGQEDRPGERPNPHPGDHGEGQGTSGHCCGGRGWRGALGPRGEQDARSAGCGGCFVWCFSVTLIEYAEHRCR